MVVIHRSTVALLPQLKSQLMCIRRQRVEQNTLLSAIERTRVNVLHAVQVEHHAIDALITLMLCVASCGEANMNS